MAYAAVTSIQAICWLSISFATLLIRGRVNAVMIILAVIESTIRMLQITSLSLLSRLISEPSAWKGWLIAVYTTVFIML